MGDLTLIRSMPRQHEGMDCLVHVRLQADRATLAKRRWRGTAADGREFGFDLEEPFGPGVFFHYENDTSYVLVQSPEEVLEVPVGSIEEAARVGWNLGNLHFGVQVLPTSVRVTEDPAVLQFLTREKIAFRKVNCVFLPISTGGHHHHPSDSTHDHSHHHG